MPNIKFTNHQKTEAAQTLKSSRIFQYDKELNLVATFSTIKEASNNAKISDTSIGKAINGERFLAGGYFWHRGELPLKDFPQRWIDYLKKFD